MKSNRKAPAFNKTVLILFITFFVGYGSASAQILLPGCFDPHPRIVISKDTKKENRERLHKSLSNGINRNLSLALTDSTEENWMDAFYSVELLRYKSPWVENKIYEAFKDIDKRSGVFQRALMELVYDTYPDAFVREAKNLLLNSTDAKCIAIAAEYVKKKIKKYSPEMLREITIRLVQYPDDPVLNIVKARMLDTVSMLPPVKELLHHPFFSNAKVVFSFQRKNRDYPGLAIVRDSTGNFVKAASGNIFWVTQLARSISNLPGYISNGNTPQGIFRMYGFDKSKSIFIGPTPNIQLTMPYETGIRHFFSDSTITDSVWTEDWYKKLLPGSWKHYTPFFETFYAGRAGRTEIIAHGTTVDPGYYKGTTYYPLTPTLGCLCTTEIWDGETGERKISDQEALVLAVSDAGGPDGYYIVVELDDQQKPVDINEILPLLK